ncbi:MAG: flagellar hook-basal body complex protein [Tissierellales bacterium]|nr:flagellar hook-basal body complex protein [Tissierellales bacterium]
MIKSLYTINRSLNVIQKRQENTSANLVNANTSGYKFQKVVQSTMETREMINYTGGANKNVRNPIGQFVFGNQVDEYYRNFSSAPIYETGNSTDFAINGDGFFTVELNNGQIAYTRNGNFRVNEANELVTVEGYRVLGENGYININDLNFNFVISSPEDFNTLISIGDTLFTSQAPMNQIEADVKRGFLEASNVNLVDEMVKLIEITREFEANQKLMHAADETLNKAVNEVGKV